VLSGAKEEVILYAWCACYNVPHRNVCRFSLCKGMHRKGIHTRAVQHAHKALRLKSKIIELCALSSWNKITLLAGPDHSGIQGNEEADDLARGG
jgi:hypothetical protein